MAIVINIIESSEQIISEIPKYLSVTITNVNNAIVYYTFDQSSPNPLSLTTKIMEHLPGDPLHGIIFLPSTVNILDLNMLAVGVNPNDTATFYRRYGLDNKNIGIGRPGIKKPISGGTGFVNTASPNIDPITKQIIANDGYTEGYGIAYDITQDGYDGYVDGYSIGVSGYQIAIPPVIYDHIYGYTNSTDGYTDGYSTTTLTLGQELNLLRLSDDGIIFIDDGHGKMQPVGFRETDPRSGSIIDSDGRVVRTIPIETFQEDKDGYTVDDSAHSIDIDYDNTPIQAKTPFTSGGMFNPRAAYIEIDGRIDGYINGTQINPGDIRLINKPFGGLQYSAKREDLGDGVRKTSNIISGGLICPIHDYAKGQSAFYYGNLHDNRWLVSLQNLTPPEYKVFSKKNGVVVGQVFKWIIGKPQVLPG